MHLYDDAPLTAPVVERAIRTLTACCRPPRVVTVGHSILSVPLRCLICGAGQPLTLYVGVHHALEDVTGKILLAFAGDVASGRVQPPGTQMILPLLNPDGVALRTDGADPACPLYDRQMRMSGGDFSDWQANARGVDLNHNYDAGFAAYRVRMREMGITGGCATRYAGTSPLSEPESAALAGLIRTVLPDAVVTLHTQGRELFCGASPAPHVRFAARLLARRIGYRLSVPTGAAAYGGLTDWLARIGIPAVTVECGSGVNPLPPRQAPALYREVAPLLIHAPRLLPRPRTAAP